MGTKSVRVYYNTGFNGLDIPGSPAVLNTLPYRDYSDVYFLREDIDLPAIKLNVPYNDVKDVDYVRIEGGDRYFTYYFATPRAEAKNTTVLYLSLDALLTMGGAEHINFLSGWITRGHIAKHADTLFANVAPEDFAPSRPLEVAAWSELTPTASHPDLQIVVTNVDLSAIPTDALTVEALKGIVSGETDPSVYVPALKTNTSAVTWVMHKHPGEGDQEYVNFFIPNTLAYDANNAAVKNAIGKLFSLGQLQLMASYTIPAEWVETKIENSFGAYTLIRGISERKTGGLYQYANVKNKKCFAMFRTATIVSLASGDKTSLPIYNTGKPSDTGAPIDIWSDPATTGKPYARFHSAYGNPSMHPYINAIAGTQWANAQLVLEGAPGSAWSSLSASFARANQANSYEYNILQNNIAARDLTARGELLNAQIIGGRITGAVGAVGAGFDLLTSKKPGDIVSAGGNLINSVVGIAMTEQQNQYNLGQLARTRETNEAQAELLNRQNRSFINENRINELRSTSVVAPSVSFPPEINLGLYGYNRFAYYETRMNNTDLQELDAYFQRYGYNGVHIPLTHAAITSRQYYNFVQASGINIARTAERATAYGMRVREKAISQLNAGVRIWHVAPDPSLFDDN